MTSSTQSLFIDEGAKPTKRERTRTALLESAVHVFATKGFDATKITDITAHASMANGTFYNYYRDKESLLRDVAVGLAPEFHAYGGTPQPFLPRHPGKTPAPTESSPERWLSGTGW